MESPAPAPEAWLGNWPLRDGRTVRFRHLRPEDDTLIAEAIRTASRETLRHRFFVPIRRLPAAELRPYLRIDPTRDVCVVGELAEAGQRRIVCGARFVRTGPPGEAEIALTVHDDFQRCGLGAALLRLIAELARDRGIRRLVAEVLATNTAMLALLRKLAPALTCRWSGGIAHVAFDPASIAPRLR